MTNRAFALEPPCTLNELLREEFSERRLAKALGREHRVPTLLWDDALVGRRSDLRL